MRIKENDENINERSPAKLCVAPRQIFWGLFIMFWTIQWYFSSFLVTLSCCLNFGIISELISDYMYGKRKYNNRLSMFTDEKEQVSSLKEPELLC